MSVKLQSLLPSAWRTSIPGPARKQVVVSRGFTPFHAVSSLRIGTFYETNPIACSISTSIAGRGKRSPVRDGSSPSAKPPRERLALSPDENATFGRVVGESRSSSRHSRRYYPNSNTTSRRLKSLASVARGCALRASRRSSDS